MPNPARVVLDAPTRSPSGRTAAYVLGTEDGVLVDPVTRTERLDEVVRECRVTHVAVTHHHPDHVGGVADYAEAFDLTVWARAGREGAFETATGVAPDRRFAPGERPFDADGSPVAVLDTPGHAPEHVGFAVAGDIVAGDLAVAAGSVVVGAPEGDMRAYLSSLRRLHAMAPDRLLPAHGPVIDRPRETCRRLLNHRLDRERRVLAAVREGHERPEALVEAVYEKDVSAVRALAEATVCAHLKKLAVEGKIGYDGERAHPA